MFNDEHRPTGYVKTHLLTLILIYVASTTGYGDSQKQKYNILDFGAVGDGKYMNTDNIQCAIDSAYKNGGGRVIVPCGMYLSGSIVLRSGVELNLLKGATIEGSTNPYNYRTIVGHPALIQADSSRNISVTGEGTIDGHGLDLALTLDSLYHAGKVDDRKYDHSRMRPSESIRPEILSLNQCSGILVKGITIKNGAGWVTKYSRCYNLVIENVKIISMAYWNNDGMDICDCRNVSISGCSVNSADDGICLKSYSPEYPDDSISISNCTIRSSASAIKFGTDSHGAFTNIRIRKIKIYDTYRSAIAIECVDGGTVENVVVSDVQAVNTGNPIFIRLGSRNAKSGPGTLKNITIEDMKVKVPFGRPDINYDVRGPELPFFHNPFPSFITGIPGHNVENVSLINIELTYPGRGTRGMAYIPLTDLKRVPEKEGEYPEFSMFGELPAWGFYVRHVDGLTVRNVSLRVEASDYRPAILLDDASNLKIMHSNIHTPDTKQEVVLNDVSQGEFYDIKTNGRRWVAILKMGKCESIKNE